MALDASLERDGVGVVGAGSHAIVAARVNVLVRINIRERITMSSGISPAFGVALVEDGMCDVGPVGMALRTVHRRASVA